MRRALLACLTLLSLQVACVTPGDMGPKGFEHSALGYSVPFVPGTRDLINDRWVTEKLTAKTYAAASRNQDGVLDNKVRYRSLDFVLKNKETRGVISVQSFPLDEVNAERNFEVMAKDYAELLSGSFVAQVGPGKGQVDSNLVTKLGPAKSGTLGKGTSYQFDFEVSQSQNPNQPLRKYRMLIVRFKAENAWFVRKGGGEKGERTEKFPAALVVTYANDAGYFDGAAADFDTLVSRINLQH